jgi:hypothetical protein
MCADRAAAAIATERAFVVKVERGVKLGRERRRAR